MKKTKKHLPILLILLIIISIGGFRISALGAGNSISSATAISLGSNYSGKITDENTNDFYKFSIPSSGRIDLKLTTYMKYISYNVYNSSGTSIWNGDTYWEWNETSGVGQKLVKIDLTQGTYYFSASKNERNTGNYSFNISFTSANESFSETGTGVNNTLQTANSINLFSSYTGQIALNDDKDFYKFSIPSSGRINLELTTYMEYISYNVYNSSGTSIWNGDTYWEWNETSGVGQKLVKIDLTQGTYYFSASKNERNTGNYSFNISFTSANESFSETGTGVNNTLQTANSINLFSSYTGQIALNDDKDFYKFSIPSSGRIDLELTTYMEYISYNVYNSSGTSIWNGDTYWEWNESSGVGKRNVQIDLTQGTYYLSATKNEGETGGYEFSLNCGRHMWSDEKVLTYPTCTTPGSKSYMCSFCGLKKTEVISPLGHSWTAWTITTAATCTTPGTQTRYCSRDTSHKEIRTISALGHRYDATVKKPTSTTLGYTLHTCIGCNTSYKNAYTAPTGKQTLKCKARTSAAQTISWNNVKTATGYQVQISNAAGNKWSTYATLKSGITNYTFKKLVAGNNYKFRVRFYIKAADGKNYFSPWSTALNSPTLPSGTAITKLTASSKAFSAQWKKAGFTGYQLQYSLKSNFSAAKTVTIKNAKTLKTTVKKLNTKKVYYIRIRTYKMISKANYFSTWSKTYKIKTK